MINRDDTIMNLILLSFESIELAYTDALDHQRHILLSEKAPTVLEVIKDGQQLRALLESLAHIKDQRMTQQSSSPSLASPVFVCLSSKPKRTTQPILRLLSPSFQKYVLYIRQDKQNYGQIPFNRAILCANEVCYGQGYSQLRQKQELRLAVFSIFLGVRIVPIFIEKHPNELKELQKEGFSYLISNFQLQTFLDVFNHAVNASKQQKTRDLPQNFNNSISNFPQVPRYLTNLWKTHREVNLKQIIGFNNKHLGIGGFLSQLFRESCYYNISAKSWAAHESSRQICSYVFHNASDSQLYLARTPTTRELGSEEDFQLRVLAYYLTFAISPASLALPQDKMSSLMKFSKIKAYENKKAYFNLQPYCEGLRTIKQLASPSEITDIFQRAHFRKWRVNGVGALLLTSILLNDNLKVKSLSEQTALLGKEMDQLFWMDNGLLENYEGELYLCRVDFYSLLSLSNYKIIDPAPILSLTPPLRLSLSQLDSSILSEVNQLLFEVSTKKLPLLKGLFLYYRWSTNLVGHFDIVAHRLPALLSIVAPLAPHQPHPPTSLLAAYPQLASLQQPQNYSYFMIPSKQLYSPAEYSVEQKEPQNPYLTYITKTCSFVIYNISFPIHSFLQWVKATGRYQAIQYISMINHSLEDYVVMDKRLKLLATNEKKNAILVVDHAQLCEPLLNRPKGVKTVMVLRLRKVGEIEDVGMISCEGRRGESLRDSQDEIIQALMREGLKEFGADSQFLLYDWVLRSYIRLKCELYELNYSTALDFSLTLHKAISTNRHRLRELKENHPDLYPYLYTLPIIKDQQKVVYNYRLFEYLHLYGLLEKIVSGSWSCKLETYQNSSLLHWRSIIGVDLAAKVTSRLIRYLLQLENQGKQERNNDCLELVRSLTETPHSEQRKMLPYCIYFDVFVQQISVLNYTRIHRIARNNIFFIVEDDDLLQITAFHHNKAQTFAKSINESFLCFCLSLNNVLYILTTNSQEELNLQRISLKSEQNCHYSEQANLRLTNILVKELLASNPISILHLQIVNQGVFLIFQLENRLVLINISSLELSCKEYHLEQQILRIVTNQGSPFIICITTSQIISIQLFQQIEQPVVLQKLHLTLTHKTSIAVTQEESSTSITIFERNQIQIISISPTMAVHTNRVELGRPIRALSIAQNLLFLFYQSDDSLYVYRLKEGSCEREQRYYWVEANASEIYLQGNTIFIRGGSFLKKIKVRNLKSIEEQ